MSTVKWVAGGRVSKNISSGALITSRTSMGMFRGTPPFPGAAEAHAANLVRSLLALAVDDPESGQKLFGFRERPVGHHGSAALPCPHDSGLFRQGQSPGVDQLPAWVSSLLKRSMKLMCALMSSGGHVPMPASFHPARWACIISMYFTSMLLFDSARLRLSAPAWQAP